VRIYYISIKIFNTNIPKIIKIVVVDFYYGSFRNKTQFKKLVFEHIKVVKTFKPSSSLS